MQGLTDLLGGLTGTSGVLAIAAVMLFKEIGVPVPVPADLIMITAGVQAATGSYSLVGLLVAVEVAVILGCSIKFLLVRSAGRGFVYRFGRFVGLTPARLDQATLRLHSRGPLAIFIGLNVPGARAGMIIAAGLAGFPLRAFAPAMVAGSSLYYGWHVALGFIVGPSAARLLAGANLPGAAREA